MNIGIIGAGFIGRALARLAIQHGFDTMVSNSRDHQLKLVKRQMYGRARIDLLEARLLCTI